MEKRSYREAIKQGWELLQAISKEGSRELNFFGDRWVVDFEKKSIQSLSGILPVKEYHEILILHYLSRERAVTLSEPIRWIGFQDLESGKFYYPAFARRSSQRLNEEFARQPEVLWERARGVERQRLTIGDFGFRIRVLPKVLVALIYWRGNGEVVSQYDLLFNRETGQIFPTEDIVVLAQTVVGFLSQVQ